MRVGQYERTCSESDAAMRVYATFMYRDVGYSPAVLGDELLLYYLVSGLYELTIIRSKQHIETQSLQRFLDFEV